MEDGKTVCLRHHIINEYNVEIILLQYRQKLIRIKDENCRRPDSLQRMLQIIPLDLIIIDYEGTDIF